MPDKMPNNKKEDFYKVVSAIVKFIETADAPKSLPSEGVKGTSPLPGVVGTASPRS